MKNIYDHGKLNGLVRAKSVAARILVMLTLLAISDFCHAITSGELDGDGHPNVGAILIYDPELGGYLPVCSGTLIDERVLLTAGHCSIFLEEVLLLDEDVFVSFDADNVLNDSTWVRVVAAVTHPEFGGTHVRADHHANDIGALILEEPVLDIEPAPIAPLNYLGMLKRQKKLGSDTRFTVVGYGSLLSWPPAEIYWVDGPRRVAESRYLALNPSFLFMRQNPATGYFGTGYGDSGGPTFYTDESGEEILVSVTSWGDPNLVATGISFRVDTPTAQWFIEAVLSGVE